MALTLEEAIRQINNNVDTMPKAISMSQAEQIDTTESILNAIPEYRDNKIERFAKGLYAGLDSVKDVLPSIELYGRNADLAIGGYFGASEEEISRKTMNIATIQRNLMANQKDRAEYTSEETAESFAYGLGQGAANLLMMYASGGATGAVVKGVAAKTAVGIATGTALENIEQQSERMPVNKLGELEVEKITPEWAKKSTIGTTSYLAASALLEKYVGFGKQTTLWETPIKFSNQTLKNISPTLKTASKGLLSEGATEGLQSLTSSGILLAEGTIKMSEMPERLQQAWKEAVIGGILGGSVGTAVAINQQVNVKTMLNEEIGKVVADPNEREAVVEAIYESGTVELTNVISKELELSSELNTKHGAIYDSMQNAIFAAIEDAGALSEESETDLAQYVSETSKMFANQVLAEANKRGCLIDDVLKASDIKYEDGKIKLQAGKETIAETDSLTDSVVAQQNYNRDKKNEAWQIVSIATGIPEKQLKMQYKKNNEKILELIANTADKLDGFVAKHYVELNNLSYKNDFANENIGLGAKIAQQAYEDLLNDNFTEKDPSIDRYEGYEQYIKEEYQKLIDKIKTVETEEEFLEIIESFENVPSEVLEYNAEELDKACLDTYNKLSEIVEEREEDGYREIDGESDQASNEGEATSYFGTTQEDSDTITTGNNQEVRSEEVKEALKDSNTKKESNKIEDVGEFLQGNRKQDTSLTWDDLDTMNDLVRAKNTTKAKIYPAPKFEDLIKEGYSEFGASLILNVYKKINNKPASGYTTKEHQKAYVDMVKNTMETVKSYIKNNPEKYTNEALLEFVGEKNRWSYKSDRSLFEAVFPDVDNKKPYNIFRAYPEYNLQAILLGGSKFTQSLYIDYHTLKDISKIIEESKLEKENNGEKAKKRDWEKTFIVLEPSRWDNRYAVAFKKGKQIIARFNTKEEAELAAQRVFERLREEKEIEKNQSSHREYTERRANGKNITAQELKDTFGFRGVNFGNWVNQKERQSFLNNTYDSLFDLAEILNLPPKALSLNGELGIAFGAQGHGKGSGAAHYIPAFKEINLTKDYGAGSLAHEWWHALDNYLGNQYAGKEFSENWALSIRDKGELREELFNALKNLQDQIKTAPFTEEDIAKNLERVSARINRNIDRYAEHLKQSYRKAKNSEELFKIIDDLANNREKYKTFSVEEMSEIENKFFKLLPENRDTISNRGEFYWLTSEIRRLSTVEEVARRGGKKTKYLEDAERLDKQENKKYWSEDTELGARAFSVWLLDKMENLSIVNRFLVRQEKSSITIDENTLRQLLEGKEDDIKYIAKTPIVTEERQRIFEGFDKLFNTLKYEETNAGYRLYQLKGTPKEAKKVKGAYVVSEKAIELFKDADYSTLPHELAHFWLDNMWSYSRSGLASDAYKNNFQGVLDFLGVKDNQLYLTRAQQEKFARAYEKYLFNGYAPNGLIQGAFDEYDRWLKKVYEDVSELKVKLNADIIEFFDSMTTGDLLDYDINRVEEEIVATNKEKIANINNDAKKVAVEANSVYSASPMINSTVPVETEGEKAQSRVYTNQSDILGLAEELDYNKVSIEEQNAKAKAFVKANLAAAQRIVNGLEQPPADILKNAIYNAYLKEMLAIGNTEAYVHALRNQSLELTRAGQEIASQRGAIENIFDSTYWIRRIENRLKKIKAVEKFGDLLDGVNETNAVNKLEKYIDTEITKVLDSFINATEEEQAEIVKNLVKNLSAELNSKPPEELYQRLREPSEVRTRTNAYNYLYRAVNEGLGLSLSSQQVNEIINKTSAIQKSIENTKDRNGNPSALFFKNMAEMENYANSIAPSPALSVLTSTIGRGNMLMSVKSIALNIESNILNFISESVIKRISYGTVDKLVDTNVIKEYLEYSKGVFNSSGYQVSTMDELDATQRILSEKQITSQGDGVIRALGRFYEQTIFKYGLGYPDLVFKDLAFVDSVNLLASKEANGDTKKATEIFKDAILLEPRTILGKEIRAKAQVDALIATYQNKGRLSDLALGIRNSINKATKQLRLGDVLSPFVKTPANVIGLGIDYTMGAYTLKDINTVINDFQNGKITDTTRRTLQKTGRNAIGVLIAIALSSLIDDEDYIPDYALLSPSERNLIKAKNGVFNSIRIGDKWVSLDYFGPFAMPLAAVLNAKREKELTNKVFNYFKGAGIQALKVPVIGDLKDVLEEAGRATNQDAEKNAQMAINGVIDFVSSRSIPALISDVAKITDDYERDTGKSALNRAMTRIPVIREQLPAKVNYVTGRAVETENALSVLLAGARVKEATKGAVIREFDKLANTQTDKKVTLSGVTKGNSLLSKLPESEKPKVEAKFAKMYSSEVSKLIKTNYYNNLDNENKVKAINKIRDKAVESLKKEYGLGKKGVKRK